MKKFKRALFASVAVALAACLLQGCLDLAAFEDGKYNLGDVSVTYCNSTTDAQRVVLRTALDGVAQQHGFSVGVDYCKAFESFDDGYTVGDVTAVWCSAADPKVRATIRTAFADLIKLEGIELTDVYCQVAGYVTTPPAEPE